MKKILFVCLGNICRSSSAEEVMRTLIRKEGLEREIEVDSAGILSYHQGELPDSRMRMHASRRGYNLTHRSRPVCTDDFYHFDMIIGMDDRNIEDLIERAPDSDDRLLSGEDGGLCTRSLLWRGARFRECIGYSGRRLRRTA